LEINSSFYRPHRLATYERWAATVPIDFRLAVKMPKEITHQRRLAEETEQLEQFLDEVSGLGAKLGPLLVQLPPSLAFELSVADSFFSALRSRFEGGVACEPRHETWFSDEVEQLLARHRIARVAADPAPVPEAAHPGGWDGLAYYRLHGSPKIYYSDYSEEALQALWREIRIRMRTSPVWCIFDNTALGAAIHNALSTEQHFE
jgi:uncharacterized protein YecE (DUF72 family)